jgi:hypothetical protein
LGLFGASVVAATFPLCAMDETFLDEIVDEDAHTYTKSFDNSLAKKNEKDMLKMSPILILLFHGVSPYSI